MHVSGVVERNNYNAWPQRWTIFIPKCQRDNNDQMILIWKVWSWRWCSQWKTRLEAVTDTQISPYHHRRYNRQTRIMSADGHAIRRGFLSSGRGLSFYNTHSFHIIIIVCHGGEHFRLKCLRVMWFIIITFSRTCARPTEWVCLICYNIIVHVGLWRVGTRYL